MFRETEKHQVIHLNANWWKISRWEKSRRTWTQWSLSVFFEKTQGGSHPSSSGFCVCDGRCTFEGPGLQKLHRNSTRRPQREKRKWEGGEGGRKARNFGRSGGGGSGGGKVWRRAVWRRGVRRSGGPAEGVWGREVWRMGVQGRGLQGMGSEERGVRGERDPEGPGENSNFNYDYNYDYK